jgi:hypothetical protein
LSSWKFEIPGTLGDHQGVTSRMVKATTPT